MPETIYIHEDDWGLRCIYPAAAFDGLRQDLSAASEASVRNRDPSGLGWTDLYVIQEPKSDYLPLAITFDRIEAAMAPVMPRVHRFAASAFGAIGKWKGDGWGSYLEDAWCFGFDAWAYVLFNQKDGVLQSICLEYDGREEMAQHFRKAFAAIESLAPSALVDYRLEACGLLADAQFVENYLRDGMDED